MCSARLRFLSMASGLGVLLTAAPAWPQAPAITSTTPQAVRPGETVDVTVRGSNLAGATSLWTSFGAEAQRAPDVKDNGTNKAQAVYRLTVPADASLGLHGLRIVTPQGVSPLNLFVVDDLPSVAQVTGNTKPEAAQSLEWPVAVDGTVANLTRQYFAVNVEAGQTVSFEVLARRIGSPLDPMIRLLDPAGRELEYCDDQPGLSGDAQLCYTFSQAGRYFLELRDIRYQGGGNHRFRLRVGQFPCVTVPYPMAAQRGTKVPLSFGGANLAGLEQIPVQIPAESDVDWINVSARQPNGNASGFATLRVTDAEQALETEPNDQPDQANRIALGAGINGRFELPGDVDRFVITAAKGQKYVFAAVTRSQGSPTDVVLRLFNSAGNKVAEAEDTGKTDGRFEYTFPADGDYTLVVEDLHSRGGSPFVYRVEVEPAAAGFALSAAADHLNIPVEGTVAITVNSVRRGYNGPIQLSAVNLPAGAVSHPTVLGPGRNSVNLTITGGAELAAGSLIPIRIVGTAKQGETELTASASIGDAVATAQGMVWPPHVLGTAMAAAAAPKPSLNLRLEPQTVVFGQNLKATVKVIAERGEAIDEAIALAVTPDKDGLPAGITAAVQPIPKGANEIAVVLSATDKAPLGEFTANLVATHKKGNATVTQPVPGIGLALKGPLTLTPDFGDAKLAVGKTLKVKVTVERNPALSAPVKLSFQNLPKGVTAPEAEIAADQTVAEIEFTAAPDAATGAVKNITVKGDAAVGDAKFTVTSSPVTLTVE